MAFKLYEPDSPSRHYLIPSNHRVTKELLLKAFKYGLAGGMVKKASSMSKTRLMDIVRDIFQMYGDMVYHMDEPQVSSSDDFLIDLMRPMFPDLINENTVTPVFHKIIKEVTEKGQVIYESKDGTYTGKFSSHLPNMSDIPKSATSVDDFVEEAKAEYESEL